MAWSKPSLSSLRPVHRIDRGTGAQRGDDIGQMLGVRDLDIDQNVEKFRRAVGDLEIGDVAVILADDGRQRCRSCWADWSARRSAGRHTSRSLPCSSPQPTSIQRSGVRAKLSSVSQSVV